MERCMKVRSITIIKLNECDMWRKISNLPASAFA